MTRASLTVPAGLVLLVFGAVGTWFLGRYFPNARFLRAGYALTAGGGLLFGAWGISKTLALGVAAAACVAVGAIAGTIGALRKELRTAVPP